ncbi:MAG: beta-galactosidase [Pedobacter sp.]|nr:beta-galactosidase [Chitinophagaceae bacterium]
MKQLVSILCLFFISNAAICQTDKSYLIDISKDNIAIISNHLKLGTHTNVKDETFDANSFYFIRNGKPWFPVMGEFHFSRYPKEQWEASILKMKACGIDVIATYVFWIYHEEQEGIWDWSGNRDLRYFATLCAKHHINLFVRIGPWCHGEVRNGGFPDWLLTKAKTRTNDSAYLGYVKPFFNQINQQLKGLYFKDGGTIIGTQIENEYRFNNPKGLQHIFTLKKMAVDAGIDVPYYSATGWPGSNIKQVELIPVQGGYPEAPWDKKTTKLALSNNYLFETLRIDQTIGTDLLGNQPKDTTNFSGYRYPYATAEMGAGIQITYHRRPIITAKDVMGLAYAKTGSGANLMGYYMFHGGSNAIGKLSTLQESKTTKYPNDYPIINYDFQSPIGEWGQLQPSYKSYKMFHYFLNDFGDKLAVCNTYFPSQLVNKANDTTTLRWSVRAKQNSGFIFVNNYQRQLQLPDFKDVQFNIQLKNGNILKVPQQAITVKKDAQFILPFNLDIASVNLVYATVQPVCKLIYNDELVYVFSEIEGVNAEYCFDAIGIKSTEINNAVIKKTDKHLIIKLVNADKNATALLTLNNGKKLRIVTLTNQQALNAWKATILGNDYLLISDADLVIDDDKIALQSTDNTCANFSMYPAINSLSFSNQKNITSHSDGLFISYTINFTEKKIPVFWQQDISYNAADVGKKIDTSNPFFYPLYGSSLQSIPSAKYYKITVPKNTLQDLSNAFLKIDYEGDTQAAYLDGKLVADDFYSGVPMTIGLNQFVNSLPGNELTLLVTPLKDESKIYFEDGIREPLIGKNKAQINSIKIIPQYQTIITGFKLLK